VYGAHGVQGLPAARKAIADALAIVDELGLQQHPSYGAMLGALGDLDRDQGRYKEALVIYGRANAVLVQHEDVNDYGGLLNSMAFCHQELHQWNEAVACLKEAVKHTRHLYGTSHPDYATLLNNLACLFAELKQYEEAIPRCEEVLAIFKKVFGDQHESTLNAATGLAFCQRQAQQSLRGDIDVGHNHRMCSQCGTVKEERDRSSKLLDFKAALLRAQRRLALGATTHGMGCAWCMWG
jgi:tetratricopeptide (TPR) repeat protein